MKEANARPEARRCFIVPHMDSAALVAMHHVVFVSLVRVAHKHRFCFAMAMVVRFICRVSCDEASVGFAAGFRNALIFIIG